MSRRHRKPGVQVLDYTSITDADIDGTNDAWWGTAKVHVKAQDYDTPYILANELISCRLAAAVGLPVLPGEIATHPDGRKCWVTPQISHGDTALPPAKAERITEAQPIVVAGMVVFDHWVRNCDRTADNVLYDDRLGVWLIDHEDCLSGRDGQSFGNFDPRSPGWSEFTDFAIDRTHLDMWTQRVGSMGVHVVDGALDEAYARGLVTRSQQAELKTFLLARRDIIRELTAKVLVASPPLVDTGEYSLFDDDAGGA